MARRVAFVTGGTRGIGAEIGRALLGDGYEVVAAFARDAEEAGRFAAETGCRVRRLDVMSASQCQAGVDWVIGRYGRLDVLVNNAGITSAARIDELDCESWQDVLEVHAGGCFRMTRAALPAMREAGYGRIVHIGSVVARTGAYGIAHYCAAKAAIEGLSRAIALEVARHGITSNVVAPGYIDAGMIATIPERVLAQLKARIPVGRLGEAREVARAVSFLADEASGFITGATLSINGGLHLS